MRASLKICLSAILLLGAGPAFGQGRTSGGTQARESLKKADAAKTAGDYAAALRHYRQALSYDRSLTDAYENIASILYEQGKFRQAVPGLGICLQTNPGHIGCTMWLGLHLLKVKKRRRGYALLEQAVKGNWKLFLAQVKLASYYFKRARKAPPGNRRTRLLRTAARKYWTFLKFRPAGAGKIDHAVRYRLGQVYLRLRLYPAAQTQFATSVKQKPRRSKYKLGLAEAYLGRKYYWLALNLYRSLSKLTRKRPKIHLKTATCYYQLRRKNQALSELQKYSARRPNDPAGVILRGDVHYYFREYGPALASYQKATRIAPNSVPAQVKYGLALLKQRQTAKALQVLTAARRRSPREATILLALGEAYLVLKRARDAVGVFGAALALQPSDATALAWRGMAHLAAGASGAAVADLEKALRLDRENWRAKRGLIRALNKRALAQLQKGANAAAVKDLTRAFTLNPKRLFTSLNLGIAHLEAKRYGDALRHLTEVHRKLPRDFAVNRLLGRLYYEQNKLGVARSHYERARAVARRLPSRFQAEVETEYGALLAAQGQIDLAVTLLESAVSNSTGNKRMEVVSQRNFAIALLDRGYRNLAGGKGKAALADLEKASGYVQRLGPDQVLLHQFLLAMAYLENGKWRKAGKLFRQFQGRKALAKVLKPPYDKLGSRYFQAYTQYRRGGYDAASNTLKRMLRRAPRRVRKRLREIIRSCLEMKALASLRRGKARAAQKSFKQAKTYGLSAAGRHNQAVALYRSGAKGRAVSAWQKGGMPGMALCNVGTYYDNQGDPARAQQFYKRCRARGAVSRAIRKRIATINKIFGY